MGTTYFRCPHCHTHIGTRGGIRKKLIDVGPSVILCANCNQPIQTGGQEWVDIPISRKLLIWAELYLIRGGVFGPAFGIMAWGCTTEILKLPQILGYVAGVIVWLLYMLRCYSIHKNDVRDSLKRKPGANVEYGLSSN